MSETPNADESLPNLRRARSRPSAVGGREIDSLAVLTEYRLRGAVVLEVGGQLTGVVDDLARALQHAIAEEPRGVVCDLSRARGGLARGGRDALAGAARHARDWPGIPVAVVGPDRDVSHALDELPLRAHLTVTDSVPAAMASIYHGPAPSSAGVALRPDPTAARTARTFLTRECLDRGHSHGIAAGCLVVNELVANAISHARTDIRVTLGWLHSWMRVAVRDRSADRPRRQPLSPTRLQGRGLHIVQGLSRSWGVLPTADGGKVVWAVLDA